MNETVDSERLTERGEKMFCGQSLSAMKAESFWCKMERLP